MEQQWSEKCYLRARLCCNNPTLLSRCFFKPESKQESEHTLYGKLHHLLALEFPTEQREQLTHKFIPSPATCITLLSLPLQRIIIRFALI